MLSEEKAISIKAKSSYWILKGQYYSISNQYDKAAAAFEHLIALLDRHPAIKKQRNLAYLSTCAQLATYGYILQQPERMEKAIKRIRETEKNSAIEQIAAGTFIVNSNLAYFDLKKDKIGLKNTIHEAHSLLQKHSKEIKPDVRLTLLLACVSGYAEYGEYDKLLEMIREFEDYIHANIRVDIRVMMYFYELIAQIETGNEQMVNDTIQNFNRFLLRNEFKSEFEQIMIKFLKVISSFSNDMKEELIQLKQQLSDLPQKSLLNQNRVLYQILMNMMDSRIAGKRFHEYLNEDNH
jgi:tetratricopeptide (TPR) repeat protein